MSIHAPEEDAAHWRKTRGLAVFTLAIGVIAGVGAYWTVLSLTDHGATVYWYTAQGVLALAMILAFYQNWRQDSIDRAHGEED